MRLPVATTVLMLSLTALSPAPAQAQASSDALRRGEYLATIMDCAGCHTPGKFLGKPDFSRAFGGSEVGFRIPGMGIFYPPNLTPDRETGLGNWSQADIVKAVRTGARPDGRMLAPAMPYENYGKLTDADATALAGYLKSLKPVKNAVPTPVGPNEKPASPYMNVVIP